MLLPSGRSVLAAHNGRPLAADLLLLVLLVAAAWSTLALGAAAGAVEPLAGAAALTAAVLLALAGTVGADRRAQLLAAALGPPAGYLLLPPFDGGARSDVWQLLGHLALFGMAALLAAVAGWTARGRRRGGLLTLAALGSVLVVMAAVAVTAVVRPGWVPPVGPLVLVGGLAWFGTATAAALLVVVGTVERRSLLRRAGLVVGLQLLAPAFAEPVVGELAAAVLLLVAVVRHLRPARRPIRQPATPKLPVRPDVEPVLPAARPSTGGSPPGGATAVRPVVDDLALLYRAIGQDVRVEVLGEPWVSMDGGGLAQLLANLLANCARHAPGAPVRVCAAARGPRVRIEVIDAGPGLPPGSTARLLRRGVRGPGSTGAGLGLAICTDLVERNRGSFTMVSTSAGCTAVVELPTARRGASAQAVSA